MLLIGKTRPRAAKWLHIAEVGVTCFVAPAAPVSARALARTADFSEIVGILKARLPVLAAEIGVRACALRRAIAGLLADTIAADLAVPATGLTATAIDRAAIAVD